MGKGHPSPGQERAGLQVALSSVRPLEQRELDSVQVGEHLEGLGGHVPWEGVDAPVPVWASLLPGCS